MNLKLALLDSALLFQAWPTGFRSAPNGSKLRYTLENLSFSQIGSLAWKRAEDAGCRGHPAIVIDISWCCYYLCCSMVADTIEHVMALHLKFLHDGFLLYSALDPECRHHTKKPQSFVNLRGEEMLPTASEQRHRYYQSHETYGREIWKCRTEENSLRK